MFCGSEGLFGIALEVTLRLLPVAEAAHTALAVYEDVAAASAQLAGLISRVIQESTINRPGRSGIPSRTPISDACISRGKH